MKKTIAVVGLGYVGLPLAVQAASKGYKVIGVDLNENLVKKVNERQSPYVNDDRFKKALEDIETDSLTAQTHSKAIGQAEVVIICVPTPTNNNVPDLAYVRAAASQIAQELRPEQLIVLESTVNPGVTRNEVLPILEDVSGLKVGKDFYLSHCPERIDPGNERFFVGNLNRVVGGVTLQCTNKTVLFYKSIIDADIIPLGSAEEAEFTKSWENTQRNIMIALSNSAAIICDSFNMDIDRVLKGLQSKIDQFGLQLSQPGIGVGGHCIPEDIHYVIREARKNGLDTRFLDASAALNDGMPGYSSNKLFRIISENGENLKDLTVALLGLAYKSNVADYRRSPSIEAGYELFRIAKSVVVHDPFYKKGDDSPIKGTLVEYSLEDALNKADIVFIGTAHSHYVELINPDLLQKHNIRYVLDGRNCLDSKAIKNAGIVYAGIGR